MSWNLCVLSDLHKDGNNYFSLLLFLNSYQFWSMHCLIPLQAAPWPQG